MLRADELRPLTAGNLTLLPVVPGKLEFALEVRRRLLALEPEAVAVELPASLEGPYRAAVARLPEITVLLYPEPDAEEQAIYVPVEPCDPFTEAVRTGIDLGVPVVFIEPDFGVKPHLAAPYPDTYAVTTLGYEAYVENYRRSSPPLNPEIAAHASGLAYRLQGADPGARTAAVVSLNLVDALLDAMEAPQEESAARREPRSEVELINPHPDCLAEILIEYPWLQHLYEDYRVLLDPEMRPDRLRAQLQVLKHAEQTYETNTGDTVVHWQRRLLARYSRNLALSEQRLTASLFDLTVAARSIVDDNYGWEVWESANRYPAQRADSDLETLNLSGEEVWRDTRKIKLRRRLPRFKQHARPSALKKRKKEARPGEWAEQIDGLSICSYPPEDLVIENYGKFLKKKAKSVLSEERERVHPFTTSLLDGIDLRETIRNWHERTIYVREQERVAGEAGSVVVIFDEDRDDRYHYLTTWLGEHQNESDMAFYSTDPWQHIVGPGIGRAEYGGFLMTLPPRRMFDVWSDPDYDFAETKAERLLLAGIDYSTERLVVYVAKKPPRTVFRTIAARMGHRIVYVPIGQLSPSKMKKVRVVHVLDSHARRNEAKDFIW
jgi:hypothetical protein